MACSDCWVVVDCRMHMEAARAGTGEVEALIRNSSFQPREAAFTRLIQQCVPQQDWQKALELWHVMRSIKELKPNTITYRHGPPSLRPHNLVPRHYWAFQCLQHSMGLHCCLCEGVSRKI